uniref:Uncharacterized protein n=1 Tax=Meloidogyne enterolobii TaxID=390850 RepID=A0A6V7WDQ3_MELEN|nr:unnamed protein product [Meloidogyne enterolobii]
MLGNENASKEQLLESCRLANALEFIQKLSDGLQTRRIAIARYICFRYRNRKHLCKKALNKAQEGRTTIIVAHRLSTIRDVDQILVFKEGRIVEVGTHTELYNQHGIFYEMVNQQQIHKREAERALGILEEDGLTTNEDEQTDDIDLSPQTGGDAQPLLSSSRGSLRSLKGASSLLPLENHHNISLLNLLRLLAH